MAEEEVSYASVVFKSNQHPQSQAEKEETVYDEVKGRSETIELTADTNAEFYQDKKANNRCCNVQYQRLACCLGILCVILLSVIIAVVVYHQSKITNLTEDVQQLETQNQQLETQRNNLTKQIQDLETNWNKLNVSRAQWSIDAYCPKDKGRRCKACQEGWELTGRSCYEVHNVVPSDRKTWEEAQEDCRGKSSDLAVYTEEEHGVISKYSVGSSGTDGYWIGLRAEGGRWKWVDESDPNITDWTQHNPPTDGQCVISASDIGWSSVSCTKKNRWLCKMKALSV
ncbi:macrophage mannose receptor 1 [Etheostoma spectabile]|uniref:macrophage mannose receptor 1 n=1 Tax=Etheostoma spectabile TaxID=54343 RepID=UPI0013AFD340|nr:macrophage mannose receptor 1-like [Etheostoma spectabile]